MLKDKKVDIDDDSKEKDMKNEIVNHGALIRWLLDCVKSNYIVGFEFFHTCARKGSPLTI